MAEASSQVLEGVFAVKKPPNLSSAQVLRELQLKFSRSTTFAPLLKEVNRKQDEQDRHQPKRRKKTPKDNVFKMGHGGTLDPMATGVLIVGIGRGTKHLGDFLECTKTYETVVLFGKSTDTYDVAGKIVGTAPYAHITRKMTEEKLAGFRGKIKQVPPIYSALRIDGMKAYEYARSGRDLPRQLDSRDMTVFECTLLDWFDVGKHDFRWPATEASEEEKAVAQKLMRVEANTVNDSNQGLTDQSNGVETEDSSARQGENSNRSPARKTSPSRAELNSMDAAAKSALHTHQRQLSDQPADAPAAKIRLTVSSGFYVRSLAHDLGIACGSLATMAELLRSRQADYTCIEPTPHELIPCITYQELEQGEKAWGPKLTDVLQDWVSKHPVIAEAQRIDDRDRPDNRRRVQDSQKRKEPPQDQGWINHNHKRGYGTSMQRRRERNSSSPESG